MITIFFITDLGVLGSSCSSKCDFVAVVTGGSELDSVGGIEDEELIGSIVKVGIGVVPLDRVSTVNTSSVSFIGFTLEVSFSIGRSTAADDGSVVLNATLILNWRLVDCVVVVISGTLEWEKLDVSVTSVWL